MSELEAVFGRGIVGYIEGDVTAIRHGWICKCPFHKENTPSFHISEDGMTYKCFGCGKKGDFDSFIEEKAKHDNP